MHPWCFCPCRDEERQRASGLSRDERRRLAEAKRRASRSDAIAALAAEVAGAPEELRAEMPGFDR
jgi:U3 small nucleolar RNA-associated protein 3